MRILLLGEYSNVHATLAKGLRALGHQVTVASNGDFWKDYPRDVDLARRPGKLGGLSLMARVAAQLPRWRGYDVVQLINPMFLELKAERIAPVYRYLRRHNRCIVLGAFGMDYYWAYVNTYERPLRYSDFNIGDTIRTDEPAERERHDWIGTAKERLNRLIANDCDAIVTGLYEYHATYAPRFPGKTRFIPYPVVCQDVPEKLALTEEPGSQKKTGSREAPSHTLTVFIGISRGRSAYKGTDIMLRAAEDVQRKYPRQMTLVKAEGLPFDEYQRVMEGSDAILDQLYSYTPSMNPLLAMSKGIVCIGGGEPENYEILGENELRPIVNVEPTYDSVFNQLEQLVLHPERLPELKRQSTEYVRRHHDYMKVARQYQTLYDNLTVQVGFPDLNQTVQVGFPDLSQTVQVGSPDLNQTVQVGSPDLSQKEQPPIKRATMETGKTKKTLALAALLASAMTAAAQNGPTMGWSSWNTYGVNINEALIKRQANAMVSKGLKDVGFDHINIDDGYFGGRDATTGQLLTHSTRFPNGLKPVVDHIHNKGLKAGIYSDAGRNTCGSMFNNDVTGKGVGLYEHDQQDADYFFKELGFDFIKVDFCGGSWGHNEDHLVLDEHERYNAIAQAIKATGREDVRMNACRWAYPGTWINEAAFSWRTTGDINDSWNSVKGILAENLYLSAYCYDGHYNDMDMLEVGRSMTAEEDKTHFGLWCIMASPLLIGCDLTTIKTATLNLLKNTELIALNQDPLCLQAYVAGLSNGCHILVKDVNTLYGKKRAFALYNPNDEARTAKVAFSDIDLAGSIKLRDVFNRADFDLNTPEKERPLDIVSLTGNDMEVSIPAHGTRIYVAEADTRLERTRYEAETAFISDYQELKNNQTEKTGIYEADANSSAGFKAGWLGQSEKNDLQWRNVNSLTGGEYELIIAFFSGESRSITVSVNGKKVQTVSVKSSNWQSVGKKTVTIKLEKGDNVIRLSNATNWMPDIDYIELSRTDQQAAVTGVQAGSGQHADSGVYDLNGHRLPKGKRPADIYVTNGHKYAVKR